MSCGGPPQADRGDVAAGQTVIEGVVTADGEPVAAAYVRLLDGTGEFTAEVVASADGEFRFFAAPGSWTVRALSPRGNGESAITAEAGVTEVALPLSRKPAASPG